MTETSVSQEAIERIETQAELSGEHVRGILNNTKRRITDEDSWYIGMVRGRQLALEWVLRELRGEDHMPAIEKMIEEGLDDRLSV